MEGNYLSRRFVVASKSGTIFRKRSYQNRRGVSFLRRWLHSRCSRSLWGDRSWKLPRAFDGIGFCWSCSDCSPQPMKPPSALGFRPNPGERAGVVRFEFEHGTPSRGGRRSCRQDAGDRTGAAFGGIQSGTRSVPKGGADKKEPIAFVPIVLADSEFPARTPGASYGHTERSPHAWQTLSIGQFLLDGTWDNGSWDHTARWSRLERLLANHREFWNGSKACFHYHSAPEDLSYREVIGKSGFAMWTAPAHFDREPQADGSALLSMSGLRKSAESGDPFAEEYAILPLPNQKGTLAVARCKPDADPPARNRYLFMPTTQVHQRVAGIFQLHESLEKQPKVVDEMLDTFSLRELPFAEPNENAAYFALATLAFNLIVALRDFVLPPELRGWPLQKIIHDILLAPARLITLRRQRWARIWLSEDRQPPFAKLVEEQFPKPKRGRPTGWRKSNAVKTSVQD